MRRCIGVFALVLNLVLSAQASAQQVVSTYSTGAAGDPFNAPTYVVFDKLGDLFVSDAGNHRVQRVDKQTGVVMTIAGTGTGGYAGDGGPATQAQIDCPMGLAFDGAGNLYIADSCQNVVRKVAPGADAAITGASDEIIETFAGNGTRDACFWTDGVSANHTSVDSPYQVAIDAGGNAFILSSDCADIIRRVDARSGLISTAVYPVGPRSSNSMVLDNLGNLLLSRFTDLEICSPTNGQILTGNEACGVAFSTNNDPVPMAFDKAGNLYLLDLPCDDERCDLAIFKATPGPDGIIEFSSTVSRYAGSGSTGYTGDGGPPLAASFNRIGGMAADDVGNLFIADTGNNVIRMVSSGPAAPNLISHPSNPTNQSTAVFGFTDGDPGIASFVCTLDHASGPCTSGVTYSNLSDGSHSFSVVAKASDGTPSNAASYTWIVDTVPPPLPSIDAHPLDPSGTANSGFTFSDTEAGVDLTCRLDATDTFCASPILYTGLADGPHTFSVVASDAAGNHSAANTFGWTVQTVVPPAPHIDAAPALLSNQRVSTLSFSDVKTGLSFLCQLDTSASTACVSPVTYIGLPDGVHKFSVIASDPVAGRSSTATTYTWTLDTTPPRVGISGAPGTVVVPSPSQFSFSGGSADVIGYLCSVDGAPFTPCSPPFSQSVTAVGDHTFAVEAVDAAGNVGPADSTTWSVTYCHCATIGDYANPAFNDKIYSASSPGGEFTVSAINDVNARRIDVSLIHASDGAVVYRFGFASSSGGGWQFSPDGTRFVYHVLPFNSLQDQVTVLDLTTSPPRQMLQLAISATSSEVVFSPSGAYFMYAAGIPFQAKTAIAVYRVAGVSTAVLMHSAEIQTFGTEGSVATWGFNKSLLGEPETAFMYAWSTGQDTFNWSVVNLASGHQVISQSSTAQAAFWQFNPCGNVIAFINQSSNNEEQVDLFSTETGVHVGEASFPIQDVTLSSTPFQEVAKISSPKQTIVIAQDPTCNPNTPTGANELVTPVASGSNTSPVTVTFSNVTQAGGTGVSTNSAGSAAPAGFQLGDPPVYYDIATSALYSGTVVVCFSYSGISFNGQPRLFHFVGGAWLDVTTSVDTVHQMICGSVSSLSPFGIFASGGNQPPNAQAGPPQVVEATSPAGALVTLDAVAGDPNNDPLTLTWSENGAGLGGGAHISITLPIGAHTITFTANDNRGGVATSTTLITIRDTTSPVLALPSAITVDATSPAGAVVSYTASASDVVSGYVAVTCTPASGSTFAIGTTSVACSASDAAGNVATGHFAVTVLSPQQMIANLVTAAMAGSFQQAANLLQNLSRSVSRANAAAACGQLDAFINQVRAQSGHTLTTAEANQLLQHAMDLKAALGCP